MDLNVIDMMSNSDLKRLFVFKDSVYPCAGLIKKIHSAIDEELAKMVQPESLDDVQLEYIIREVQEIARRGVIHADVTHSFVKPKEQEQDDN